MSQDREGAYIQTYSGTRFYPLDPRPEDINIADIAHALSNICRFTGHTKHFYSVAQHCVLMSRFVGHEHKLAALMHDASEAYLADVSRPVKMLGALDSYHVIEHGVMTAIADKFGFQYPLHESVKEADSRMLFTEKRDLMRPMDWGYEVKPYKLPIIAWSPEIAKIEFQQAYQQLCMPEEENTEVESHIEQICCPYCEKEQPAIVKHTFPFYTYIHDCTNCGYTIMESEWEKIDVPENKMVDV